MISGEHCSCPNEQRIVWQCQKPIVVIEKCINDKLDMPLANELEYT